MKAVLDVVLLAMKFYTYLVIANVVMSMLFQFNVIDWSNQTVRQIWNAIAAVTEPVLQRIRAFLPATGGIDLSPLVLLLGLYFVENIIVRYIYPNVF
jgi:YggT family protein